MTDQLPSWAIAQALTEWRDALPESGVRNEVKQQIEARAREILARPPPGAPDGPLSGKYAEVLAPFVAMMENELHANSGKGDRPGWLSMDRKTALLEIFYHLAKLQKATKDNDLLGIREYSADVANMSMMLADICGALDAAPAPGESP